MSFRPGQHRMSAGDALQVEIAWKVTVEQISRLRAPLTAYDLGEIVRDAAARGVRAEMQNRGLTLKLEDAREPDHVAPGPAPLPDL